MRILKEKIFYFHLSSPTLVERKREENNKTTQLWFLLHSLSLFFSSMGPQHLKIREREREELGWGTNIDPLSLKIFDVIIYSSAPKEDVSRHQHETCSSFSQPCAASDHPPFSPTMETSPAAMEASRERAQTQLLESSRASPGDAGRRMWRKRPPCFLLGLSLHELPKRRDSVCSSLPTRSLSSE